MTEESVLTVAEAEYCRDHAHRGDSQTAHPAHLTSLNKNLYISAERVKTRRQEHFRYKAEQFFLSFTIEQDYRVNCWVIGDRSSLLYIICARNMRLITISISIFIATCYIPV